VLIQHSCFDLTTSLKKRFPTVGTIFKPKSRPETSTNTLKKWAEAGVEVRKGAVRLQK
jgi:hypothetical protein